MFPARIFRFCTQNLKIFPIQEWMETEYDGIVVNAVGIRAEESKSRSKLGEYEDVEWCITWRPLLKWTIDDVIAIHKRHGLQPNPLYNKKGISRVGCWPCIFSRKSEIRAVAEMTPERIDLIRDLESQVQESARLRLEKRGETFESKGYKPPTFFSINSINNDVTPIDEVVKWSRTSYGGKQYELFYDPDRSSCIKWGLCDT